MLVQFTVRNYRSFKDEATLSMVASDIEEHPEQVLKGAQRRPQNLLRAAGVFGANASGKSNLIRAMALAKDLVLNGTRSGDAIRDVTPFRLNLDGLSEPSTFDFVIDVDGRLYSYGFAVTSQTVVEEWLFVRESTKSKDVMWYERTTAESGDVKVKFSKAFVAEGKSGKDFLGFVGRGTRPNQLFLTEAIDRNVEALKPLTEWFGSLDFVVGRGNYRYQLLAHDNKDFAKFLRELLQVAGTGIDAITTEETPLDWEANFPEITRTQAENLILPVWTAGDPKVLESPAGFQLVVLTRDGSVRAIVARSQHRASDGGTISFEITEESDGTQRFLQLAHTLFLMRQRESVFVIDELERSLHPLLCKMFVEAALSNGITTNSQLIFSTHNTDLLDDTMRRDEIWLVEKGEEGASHLRSLAEFAIRPELKIRKGYLNGRFGAVPLIGDLPETDAEVASDRAR
jgi:uncharacterized protein